MQTKLLLVIALFLASCGSSNTKDTSPSDPKTDEREAVQSGFVSLVIAYNDSSKQDLELDSISWKKGMSVSDAMRSLSGKVPVKTKSYTGIGKLLVAVDGVAVTDEAFWYLCVNDTASAKGMDDRVLAAGDKVLWHFGKTNPCAKKGMEF